MVLEKWLRSGDGVYEFKVEDNVVSTFYPYWLGGEMTPAAKRDIPGESFEGYANRLKPVIDRRFPLQEIVAAFKNYESQKHFGKICLEL